MPPPGPVRAFLSYAHEDHVWRDAVLKHIGWLSHTHQLDTFDDRELKPGELWDERVGKELERADIVIALISPDFVFSRYCSVDELLRAVQRQRDGSADLVPIVCDHVDLGALPLAAHQCLPQDERNDLKPLVDWPNPNLPLARCAAKIRALVEARRPPPAAEPGPAAPPPTPPVAAVPNLGARLALWGVAKLARLVGPVLGGHLGTLSTIRLPLPAPTAPAPTPEPPAAESLPPHGRLIGRETDLDQLTSWILDDAPQPIAVLGPGGIGKSRLTIAALHDQRVTDRFGACRLFVSLEQARDGPGVFAAIAEVLGLTTSSQPRATVFAALRVSPTLLVLDNAETPWEADLAGAERAFARLAELPGVSLVAPVRGFELPGLADWRPLILEPLPEDAARTLFTGIAGDRYRADPDLPALLARLDGLPLAIELVAHRAQTEPDAAAVLRQWDAERSSFVRRGEGGRKDLDLAVSLSLSLASPRMTEPARRLFAALGRLPHGLARADLRAVMPEGGDNAASTLAQMALIRRDRDRLLMLAPIRELAAEQPLSEFDAAALVNHFGALADTLPHTASSSYGSDAALRARVEIANIEAILPQTSTGETAAVLGRRWVRIGDTREMLGSVTPSLAAFAHARSCFVAAAAADPTNTSRQRDLAVSWERLGGVRQAQGDLQAVLEAYTESQTILAKLAAADPGNAEWQRNLSVSWNKLGGVHQAQGDLQAALDAYTESQTILAKLAAAYPGNAGWQRDLSVSWEKLGGVRQAQGDLQAALDAYTADMEITAKLAATDPGNAEWQRDLSVSWNKLGGVREAQGDLAGALDAYTESQTIRAMLAAADRGNAEWQRDLAVSWERLGGVREAQGDRQAALDAYTAGMEITAKLAAADPGNAEWQRDLSINWERLGDVREAQGDRQAALDAYTESQTIIAKLAAADPGNAEWQRDLSISWNKLGGIREAQGDLQAALDAFNVSYAIRANLAAADPSNSGWQRDLAVSWNKLGGVCEAQGNLQDALGAYTVSQGIRAKLVAADPSNSGWQRDLAVSWDRLGSVRQAQGDLQAALDAYTESQTIRAKLAAADPGNAVWQRDLIVTYWKLANLLERFPNRAGEAVELWSQALARARSLADTGRLAPPDDYFVTTLEQRLAAAKAASTPPP